MTQSYSIIQAIRRPDKTTKKTQVRGETKSKEEVKKDQAKELEF